MNVMRRRQRRASEAVRLNKRKQRHAYELWQANQIKIWTGMNEQALLEENNLKNSRPLLVIEMESKLKKIVQGTNMEQRSIKKFVKPSKEVQDELKRLGYD